MIKWWNSITFKLFILVFIILIMIISFTYTILYFFLPSFYYDYKIEQVEQQTHLLLEESSSLTMQQFKEKLFYFSEQTGAYVTLADDVTVYSSFPFDNDDLFASKKDIVNNDFNAPSTNIEADEWNQSVSSIYYIDSENDETMYTNKEDVHLKNGILSLFISLPLQSMDDVSQSLIKFIPYIVTISFLLSIIFAFIFS